MANYDHKEIEETWQDKWEKEGIYKDYSRKKKFYALDMFPYPSGAGLHVGHPKGYIATDVVSRYKMLNEYSVIHPMGWDAFGLPAENYAIQNKVHPREAVEKNIATFKEQLKKFGFTYDWDREVNTTDPEYYKWTQWIFLKMFEKGLAYESNEPVNWCPSCKTVLANEDLENGKCERCGSDMEQKRLRQWVLKMTDYADRLLYDLDSEDLDWEEMIKEQQRNWIGRSEGAQFEMKIKGSEEKIEVYTTRLDTVFGMTYAVVAPEHPIIERLKDKIENYKEINDYKEAANRKTELERTELQKEKTGVELKGIKVVNPFNNEEISLFVADYVLGHYGTGAVMAVPAHDERDWEFARKNNLEIRQSIAPVFEGKDEDAPVKTEKRDEREVINVIIKHWEKDEYVCLDWTKFGWKSFVIGGVEDGETGEEAAIREVKEETGYYNVKSIKKIGGEVHNNFHARHKGIKNRYVKVECFYIELADGSQEKTKDEHTKNHEFVWIKKDKVKSFLNLENHSWYWDEFVNGEKAFVEDGAVVNSDKYDGLTSEEARGKMTEWLDKKGLGKKKVNYKMRDWVFSRQRYWGEPIPVVHCEKCGVVGVDEKDLPVRLPDVQNYEPTGTGEGPLAGIEEWVNTTCPKCGGKAKRETNTMPQWAGSSWYYLRYIDPKNSKKLIDKKLEKEWMPVDLYVGGAEHATRHLLYARFWHKFLFDIGAVSTIEPFKKLVHVGLINAEDGRKMSKRWNNVINPDDIIEQYGADSIRLYEMFMGPFTQNIAWSTDGVKGVRRFLDRIWDALTVGSTGQFVDKESFDDWASERVKYQTPKEIEILLHKTIKKVTEDIENFRFNTAISQMMVFRNMFYKVEEGDQNVMRKTGDMENIQGRIVNKSDIEKFLIILSPFAPHMAEELWAKLGNKESIFKSSWPKYDAKLVVDETVKLVLQVNGKLRDMVEVATDISEEEAKKIARENEKVKKWIEGKEVAKEIFVKNKLVNIVIK